MNCIVCVACVPDTASVIKIGPDGTGIDETGIKWIISPYDEYALEEALQLTEAKGGEVTAVVRVKPGSQVAPVAVHLIDWAAKPERFEVHLDTKRFFGGEGLVVPGVKEAEVIPARAGPLRHRVQLAAERLSVTLDVDPVGGGA